MRQMAWNTQLPGRQAQKNSLRRLHGLIITCLYPSVFSSQVDSEDVSQIRISVRYGMSVKSIAEVVGNVLRRQHWHSPIDDAQY